MTTSANGPAPVPAPTPRARRVTIAALLTLGALIVLGSARAWSERHLETTEDAYVEGDVIQVTPQTSGAVTRIHADNTDAVTAGQLLVELNPADAQVALGRAEAQLAKAVRQVRGQFSQASQMQANLALRQAELARAQSDLARRQPLAETGAVSAEDFRHAEDAVQSAQAALLAATQQYAANRAQVDHTTLRAHPDVLIAASQVRDAYLAAARTTLRAPASGTVTRRSVQLGQRVSPGTALMTIVPLDQVWVTANFKESQLARLRVGQPVRLTADVYGAAVDYSGHVVGLDAGTGSAFSLMPAQNATGNWIKVVQRVPVRIALDTTTLRQHPLRVGLSMKVAVDTGDATGPALAAETKAPPSLHSTDVFDAEQAGAQALVERLIASQIPAAPSGVQRPAP